MEKREIIETTIGNMNKIYQDTAKLIQIIEENMENDQFQPFGSDSACSWWVSSSYKRPDLWLLTHFARAYSRNRNRKKAVGFCIHLGGYSLGEIKKANALGLKFPFTNISILEQEEDFKIKESGDRKDVWEWLWGAGWWENLEKMHRGIKDGLVTETYDEGGRNITYFLDFLSLTDQRTINQLIVEPMKKLYSDEEDWVVRSKLPVIAIKTPEDE
jgi:hypothetical protein